MNGRLNNTQAFMLVTATLALVVGGYLLPSNEELSNTGGAFNLLGSMWINFVSLYVFLMKFAAVAFICKEIVRESNAHHPS